MNNAENNSDDKMLEEIASFIKEFEKKSTNLIPILQEVQHRYQYIAPEAIKLIANYLEITNAEIYGVATFYNQFRFNPPGKHQIKVCSGTACHVRGSDIILENFERKLDIEAGETTEDREFSIDKVACVGCCALAPVAVIDEKVHAKVSPSRVEGIFLGYEIEKQKEKKAEDNIQGNN